MATNATDKKGTARLCDYILLGVDETGAHHVADYETSTVHIVHADGSRGRRLLDAGDTDDYMDAVERARGWRRREYGVGLVDLLTRGYDP
jgi:hypothetical protein